jgi:hypothetical protein
VSQGGEIVNAEAIPQRFGVTAVAGPGSAALNTFGDWQVVEFSNMIAKLIWRQASI